MSKTNTNNISLALSLNYTKEFLTPFLESFEKCSTGILHLITDLPLEQFKYKKVNPVCVYKLLEAHKITHNITAFNLKPILFYLYLKQFDDNNQILITDVDVVFQQDPFALTNQQTDYEFIVCEELKLFKDCVVNTTWLQVSYPELIKELAEKKILNSGVIFGKKYAIQDYFKKMAYEMQYILPKCNYPILDQVILNVLYYNKKTITPHILPHNNGFIIHLSQVDDHKLSSLNITKENTFIYNDVCNRVVHQYNKKPLLDNFFKKLYSSDNQ